LRVESRRDEQTVRIDQTSKSRLNLFSATYYRKEGKMAIKCILTVFLLGCVHLSTQNRCTSKSLENSVMDWKDLQSNCQTELQNQIQMELEASIHYLAMSAHFSHSKTHRPGVAKFFLDSAIEERSHAKKLIEYLLMRGGDLTASTISTIAQRTTEWESLETALAVALQLEYKVTASIKRIIKICGAESNDSKDNAATAKNADKQENDYHAVDYLTGEFLKEQHEGTRQIAGHLATLKKMTAQYGNFAELMFDKSLSA